MKDIKNVLVVNSGSSSLKFTVYDMAGEKKLASGLVERIGANANMVYRRGDGPKAEKPVQAADHAEALRLVCAALTDPATGVLASLEDVDAIGHRVLHGADLFKEAGIPDVFVQDNMSSSRKGVLRGLHFQKAPYAQGKLVRVVEGY